jgi:hypothetical protein
LEAIDCAANAQDKQDTSLNKIQAKEEGEPTSVIKKTNQEGAIAT